jgi:heat shock protein HtpX
MPIGFWWFYDPFTMSVLFAAYILGFLAIQLLAVKLAPKFASAVSARMSLYTAMALTAILIVLGGIVAIYGIYSVAASYGFQMPVEFLVVFVLVANFVSYLAAPWMINLAYGARRDPQLQAIVDEAARMAGMSRSPRAVVVRGPPNAFAYGNFISGRYVAVSESLMSMVSREELLAVVGHELGHHRHRDIVIVMLLGLVPSILYYMGLMLVRASIWGSMGRDREGRSGGLVLAALGALSIVLSLVMQVAVLAFSRLREYYADAHGARLAGARPMQRALAKIHLYYSSNEVAAHQVGTSKLRAIFIYALVESVASPFYSGWRSWRWSAASIDEVVERLKRADVNPAQEVFSSHPPIPKRLRFLDRVEENLGGRP